MWDDRANDWLAQEMRREGYHLKGDHPVQQQRGLTPAQRLKRQHEQNCEAGAIRDEHAAYCDAESVREESRNPPQNRTRWVAIGVLVLWVLIVATAFLFNGGILSDILFLIVLMVVVVGGVMRPRQAKNDDRRRRR